MGFNFVHAEFEQWSPSYDNDARTRGHYQGHTKVAEHIRRWTGNIDGNPTVIADLGVGTGLVLEELRPHFQNAVMHGYDLSGGMLNKCRDKQIADFLVECNLEEPVWPIAESSADIVTSAGLLDFISNPDNFLANTHLIMKPGAVAALTYEVQEIRPKGPGSVSPKYGRYPREMREMALDKGLQILDEETFRGYAYYGQSVTYGLITVQKPFPV